MCTLRFHVRSTICGAKPHPKARTYRVYQSSLASKEVPTHCHVPPMEVEEWEELEEIVLRPEEEGQSEEGELGPP